MRAMVYRGPYKIRVEEKSVPSVEHPNDAIVRVTLAAICGSDIHLYHGLMPDTRVGHTFGHEFIGVVEEVGPSVRNLKRGDRVMVSFNVYCGSCFFCSRGLYSNCHNVNPNATAVGGIYGYSHTCGGYDGGQAEFVRVPFADVGPSLIPEWMDDEDAVLLTDALPTGYFGAQLGDIAEGDVVVVFDAGPVGLFAAKSACSWVRGGSSSSTTSSTGWPRGGSSPTPRPTTSPNTTTSSYTVRPRDHRSALGVSGPPGGEVAPGAVERAQVPHAGLRNVLPAQGPSGMMRKYAYRRFSEARAAQWLLLMAANRVDSTGSHLRSFLTLRPDNPITETGEMSEFTRHGVASRVGKKRADLVHSPST